MLKRSGNVYYYDDFSSQRPYEDKSRHYRRTRVYSRNRKKMKEKKVSSLLVVDRDGKPVNLN